MFEINVVDYALGPVSGESDSPLTGPKGRW